MIPPEFADAARLIGERLLSNPIWKYAAYDESERDESKWFRHLESSIVVLLDGKEPLHVEPAGTASDEDSDAFSVSAVVLTEGRLVDVVASKSGRSAEVEWTVTASSLSRAQAVSVEDSADPWDGRIDTKWPDVRRVRFTLDDDREVVLNPPGPNSEDRAALHAVAQHLLAHLG